MVGRKEVALGAAVLCLTALPLVSAPATDAAGEPAFDCGQRHTGKAKRNPNPKGRPPLAIGDSTMLLPIPDLNRVGYSVDARGCRGFRQSVNVARQLRKQRRLPHLVVINAYGNKGVDAGLIRLALKVLGPNRVLGLVTTYDADTGAPPAPDTDVLFAAAEKYPNRIAVLDWVEYSLPHHQSGDWFLPDLFHPNFAGAAAYAKFLARLFPLAREGRFPLLGPYS